MRYDDKELTRMSQGKADIEGKLEHRAPPGTFRESGFRGRYFKLVKNMLFYFRINEFGAIPDEPTGVLVIENSVVNFNSEAALPFAFEITFLDEPDRKHVFTARTENDMQQWVKTLRQGSYQYWKQRHAELTTAWKSKSTEKSFRSGPVLLELDSEANHCTTPMSTPRPSASTMSSRSWPTAGPEVPTTTDLIKF